MLELIKHLKPHHEQRQRHSLTLPGSPIPSVSQPECQFLTKLPLELRLMVYGHVIRSWGWGEKLHVFADDGEDDGSGKLRCASCRYRDEEEVERAMVDEHKGRHYVPAIDISAFRVRHNRCCKGRGKGRAKEAGSFLSLFLSCRSM